MKIHQNRGLATTLRAFLINLGLAYAAYMVCRIVFVCENWKLFRETLFDNSLLTMLGGSLLFDTSAIFYTNILWILLMLLPLHHKEGRLWQRSAKWVFIVVNYLAIYFNLCDCVYYQFVGRRTNISVFTEFANEQNVTKVLLTESMRHWYLVLIGLLLFVGLWRLYVTPKGKLDLRGRLRRYYAIHVVALLLFVPLCIGGMRGGFTKETRPITLANANLYANKPSEANIILNTPFCLLRSTSQYGYPDLRYYSDEQLDQLYSPIWRPDTTALQPMVRKNVVILILESFGREYIGAYNRHLDGGKYQGYTPFLDSLYHQSTTFEHSFANGRKSIDGMPSILSSIPCIVVPLFLSQRSMNEMSGLAHELKKEGYGSAFFHGAHNTSMGFQAFARSTGFDQYFGKTEYDEDRRFGGEKDYDGTWAVWDEPFLQFYALKMSEMKEPFITSVFTASSHHPFAIPDRYRERYPEDGINLIHKCIRYSDHALQHFFDTARKQPWFKNTIFVLTCDHTNQPDHAEYETDLGVFAAPIFIYDPSHTLFKAEHRPGIAQQIDIMPTLLNAMHYAHPYLAFGQDLLNTPADRTWAVSFQGAYQYVYGDYFMQHDSRQVNNLYNFKEDPLFRHNLAGQGLAVQDSMERSLKAILQSYMQRMNHNQLTVKE